MSKLPFVVAASLVLSPCLGCAGEAASEATDSATASFTECTVDLGAVELEALADRTIDVPAGGTLVLAPNRRLSTNGGGKGWRAARSDPGTQRFEVQISVPRDTMIPIEYRLDPNVVEYLPENRRTFSIRVGAACKPSAPIVGRPWGGDAEPSCNDLSELPNLGESLDGKTFDVAEGEALSFFTYGIPEVRHSTDHAFPPPVSASWSQCSLADTCFQAFSMKATGPVGTETTWRFSPWDSFYAYEPSLNASFTIRTAPAGTCALDHR